MKGDLTRSTFDKAKHYSSVRWQQGRVQVDADWNEEMDILAHGDRTTRRDVIGPCGGPAGTDPDGNPLAGFLIYPEDGELHISPGRYYVDGLLVENEAPVSLLQQPDLPLLPGDTWAHILMPPGTELADGTYLAFLDVWEHHVTALEDPAIREVALGGPDTATRAKVVWQAKLMPAESENGEPNCASNQSLWQAVTAASTGRLTAQAEPEEEEAEPCIVPAQAGYRGLENQLYRVEVHRVVSEDEITLKWSRENGSVVSAWLGQDTVNPNRLTVQSTGRDQVLGFAADDWAELTDDGRELRGEPGLLVQIQSIEGDVLIIDPGSASVSRDDFPWHPKVRRWDMPGEVGEISVDLTIPDNWIALESGIQVKAEAGTFRTGDYWLIPARTADRDIQWPHDDANAPLALLPHGIHHHYCPLALVRFEGESWSTLSDCRRLFPPLTEMLRFFHVGGDGQEAMPSQFLPQPLQVGVSNGQWPVEGAEVAFRIIRGNGRLQIPGSTATRVVVATDEKGIAQCRWRLDDRTLSQQVEATLVEIDGKPLVDADGNPRITPLYFNANLSVASQVAYDPRNCPDLSEARTVQAAIDILCRRPQGGGGCCVTVGRGGTFERLDEAILTLLEQGERDICLCLLAGEHVTERAIAVEGRDLRITIRGCGQTSRLALVENPWAFRGLGSVVLRDLTIEVGFPVNIVEGAIYFRGCSHIVVAGCSINGFTPEGPLLSIMDADQVWVRHNVMEASRFDSLEVTHRLLAVVDFMGDLFELPARGQFQQDAFQKAAWEVAERLAREGLPGRRDMHTRITRAMRELGQQLSLSNGEALSISKLLTNLGAEAVEAANMYALLLDIRRAAIKARPGTALVLGGAVQSPDLPQMELGAVDEDDLFSVESNDIAGIVSLYGPPASPGFVGQVLTEEFLKALGAQLREGRVRVRGLLGTLNVRGNQLAQVTVSAQVVEDLAKALEVAPSPSALFGRCHYSGNVFEGGNNLMVSQHLAMTANGFKMMAAPTNLVNVGMAIADTTIYTGNHSQGRNRVLRDVSRASAQAANLEITIG